MRLDYQRGEYTKTFHIYCADPSAEASLKRLRILDDMAVREIERLQNELSALQAYRLDLMDRAQYLSTASYTVSVELHRHKRYCGGVEYNLQIVRTYEDGTRHEDSSTIYTGKERYKAISDYKAACKSHPGAETVLDIEKGRWER